MHSLLLTASLLLPALVVGLCLSEERLAGYPPETRSPVRKVVEQVSSQDKGRRTPLHWAAIQGDKVRIVTRMD